MQIKTMVRHQQTNAQSVLKHNNFLPSLFLSIKSYDMEKPFSQLGSAFSPVIPPNFLFTPSQLTGGVVWEAEKALTLCKHC